MNKPYDQQTEEELMEAVTQDDLGAFDELTRRIQPRLFAFCRRHLRQDAAAEDAVQEALLRLFKHRDRYIPGKRVSTWLFTIALNLCRDYYRSNGRNLSLTAEAVQYAAEHSRYRSLLPDPLDAAQKQEMAELLLAALEELPETTRQLLELRSKEGLTFEEAAMQVGIKADAARASASRAYKKLKILLNKKMDMP